ncbi:MAG: hypothetical protein M9900_13880 [Flavobacteriales bacterium]|nr:hypothetical protein [Flavobacteriales bacterium]
MAAKTPVPLVPAALFAVVAPLFQSAVAAPATTRKPAGKVELAVPEEVVPMDEKSWVSAVPMAVMFIWPEAPQGTSQASMSIGNCRHKCVAIVFMWAGLWMWEKGEVLQSTFFKLKNGTTKHVSRTAFRNTEK